MWLGLATWLCQFAHILRFELSLTFTRLTNAEAENKAGCISMAIRHTTIRSLCNSKIFKSCWEEGNLWEIWVIWGYSASTRINSSFDSSSLLSASLALFFAALPVVIPCSHVQPTTFRKDTQKFHEIPMKWIWSGKKHNGKEWHCKPCHLRDLPPNIELHTLWDRKFSYSRSLSTSFSVFFQDCFAFLRELGSKHRGSASDLYFKDVCALRMISIDHRNKHLVFTHPVKFLNISLIIFHVCYIRVFPTNGCFLAYSCVVLLNIVEYYHSEKLMSLLQTKVSAIKHKLRSPRLSHITGDHRHTSTVPFLASWLQNKECKSKDLVHQVDEVRHISKMDIPQCSRTIRCISYLLAHVSFRRGKTITTYNTSIVAMSANAESWSKINGKWLTALRMRWSSPPGIVS